MMTASDTKIKVEEFSSTDGYSNFVNLLVSREPHEALVPARVLRAVLTKALADAPLIDQAKKGLMYGMDGDAIASFRAATLLTSEMFPGREYPVADRQDGLRRLHAALGMRTEADEILRQELDILCGKPVPEEEQIDEIGDLGWYVQLYLNTLSAAPSTVRKKNIAKLLKRFESTAFKADRARHPDKAAEAAAQLAQT